MHTKAKTNGRVSRANADLLHEEEQGDESIERSVFLPHEWWSIFSSQNTDKPALRSSHFFPRPLPTPQAWPAAGRSYPYVPVDTASRPPATI